MARITKDSKVRFNGSETRWMRFPDNVYVLNNDECNVWGYDQNGDLWFQRETGVDNAKPYESELFYTSYKNETAVGFYAWVYRCMQECHRVAERTLICNGKQYGFGDLFSDNRAGYGTLRIPLLTAMVGNPAMITAVVKDNAWLMFQYKGMQSGDTDETRYLLVTCASAAMYTTVARSVAEVDRLIAAHVGVGGAPTVNERDPKSVVAYLSWKYPERDSLTPEQKVRIAKVIYDWLLLNNVYKEDVVWEEEIVYAALSGFDESDPSKTPNCVSYAIAAHYLLSRYGIVNVIADGEDIRYGPGYHAWNMVNYHAAGGEFPKADDEWCIFDCTGEEGVVYGAADHPLSWEHFNTLPAEGKHVIAAKEIYPTVTPTDGEHRYDGDERYGW